MFDKKEVYVLLPFPMVDSASLAHAGRRSLDRKRIRLHDMGLMGGWWPVALVGKTPEEACAKAAVWDYEVKPILTDFQSGREALEGRVATLASHPIVRLGGVLSSIFGQE